jgi:hypothetical protein
MNVQHHVFVPYARLCYNQKETGLWPDGEFTFKGGAGWMMYLQESG